MSAHALAAATGALATHAQPNSVHAITMWWASGGTTHSGFMQCLSPLVCRTNESWQ
jgi:hypothetical protein